MFEQVESVDDFFEAATRGGWMVYVFNIFQRILGVIENGQFEAWQRLSTLHTRLTAPK